VTQVPGTDVRVVGTFGDYGGGNPVAEVGNAIIDYDGATGNPGSNFFSLKNMNVNRDPLFRYAMFVHQTNARLATNDCTSGSSKGSPGANFYVSLGGLGLNSATPPTIQPCWGVDANNFSVGTQPQQAGALLHEFGHTLGLGHGGGDPINNKPNYLSVMSYSRFPAAGGTIDNQACGVPAVPAFGLPGGCDYSRIALPALNENSLDECLGIDGGVLGLGAVDFDGDMVLEGVTNCQPPNNGNVTANVNRDTSADANGNGIQDGTEPPVFGILNGFQDWGALVYNFRNIFDFTSAGTSTDQEPDPRSIESARSTLTQAMRPALKMTGSGPADGAPGQTLAYNVLLENRLEDGARGPALNVMLAATKPDLSTQTFNIGTVVLRASINNSLSFSVPCTSADGLVLTNTFRARGTDLLNALIDVSSSTTTVIHAPVMVVMLTASGTVNAGEAITYTLRYENTGGGPAVNVVISWVVPKDVYYSLALDQGSGPKPASITLNPDGTRTLVWNLGTVPAHSGARSIGVTARPTLLALGGTSFVSNVSLSFQKGAGCAAESIAASAATVITLVPLSREHEPRIHLHWKRHAEEEPAETLARIQATDQRFDGRASTPADGALAQPEVKAAFAPGNLWVYLFHLNRPIHLEQDLLALYFNLATRRVNADSPIEREHDTPPGFVNVRDVGLNAQATLAIPYSETSEGQYHQAKEMVEEINH
jgi:uncharacterized repeat protein (TIGR01451 family)